MQSTEEYLDQLLASVSEDEVQKMQDGKQNTEREPVKDIEDLDETELTEEELQKHLALLLGMEVDTDELEATEKSSEDVMDLFKESEPDNIPESTSQVSDSGVLSPDEIAALFATMGNDDPLVTDNEMQTERIDEPVEDKESQIVDIPVLELDEEILLDIENIDAMLEATAKMAEEESTKAENVDEQVEEDIMSMLAAYEAESVQESMRAEEESVKAAEDAVNTVLLEEDVHETENNEAEDGKKKKDKKQKVKKEKVKKEKAKKEKDKDESGKKPSLKEKISAFMFEDESLDDDENHVLAEDGELQETPAKQKKEKKKKEKKGKGASASQNENAAIEAELAEEDKKKEKKKKEKTPKEKKHKKVVISEKTPEEEAAERRAEKHSIGTKGIVATLLVCASILGLILVGTYFVPKYLSLVAARVAFYAQDYEETTMRLMGRKLNESDRIMYEKASLLFGLEERYHQYEIYVQRDMPKEALNQLLQGVVACNEEEMLVNQLGIETEWRLIKELFIQALDEQYALDAETVEIISQLRNPDYTVAVENIMAGRAYYDRSAYGGSVGATADEKEEASDDSVTEEMPGTEEGVLNPDKMEDLLPEETEIIQQMQQEDIQETTSETTERVEEGRELYSGSVEGGTVNFVQ